MEGPGSNFEHVPVMAREVVGWLAPVLAGGLLVDCTLGGGGHSAELLAAVPDAVVLGIDRDEEALAWAGRHLAEFEDRVRLHRGSFAALSEAMRGEGFGEASAILYDLGVSSPQLDRAERGFGYGADAPLDMRMDRSGGIRAEEVVNTYPEERLVEILRSFGEERFAPRIARAIVKRRRSGRISRTAELAEMVREAIPAATRRSGAHPARRTFQALRIEVNGELEALQASLPQALQGLRAGGRIAVISYHSLEDRIVKRTFADANRGCSCPSDFPICVCGRKAHHRVLTKKPQRPSDEEVASNPRSRSARLRVAQRLGEPGAA